MHAHKILNIHSQNSPLEDTISRELNISRILAQLLINRGIKTAKEAEEFLQAKLDYLYDPFDFSDMPNAVRLIQKAVKNNEGVLLCGDYDVDGVTALALLKSAFQKLGSQVLHYIPHRLKEGYGLNKNILTFAKEKKIKLLITADCGSSSNKEIKSLRENQIEVIITDHHEPQGEEPVCASAILNPKLKGCQYRFRDLAGVGVAYKLAQAITRQGLWSDLDLVSLGTIADVVPLRGENRIFAKEGLRQLGLTKKIGIRALIEASRLKNRRINSTFVSFILGPRINASGRMDSAETALRLLLSKDEEEARGLAQSIEGYNRQRQKIENQILEEAKDLIDREINFKEHKVIVVAKEGWHQGVLGVVASKLTERFYRPTIVISLSDELCKGSGRSVKNFHLFQALCDCKKHLLTFGGHSHAVGLLITKDNLEDFKKEINLLAQKRMVWEDLIPSVDIDMEISLADLKTALITELELLEPHGTGNPEPLFLTRGLKVKGEPQVLGRETLKFWVTDGNFTRQVIGFGMSSFRDSLLKANALDLVYTPRFDSWQGEETVILEAGEIFFK